MSFLSEAYLGEEDLRQLVALWRRIESKTLKKTELRFMEGQKITTGGKAALASTKFQRGQNARMKKHRAVGLLSRG